MKINIFNQMKRRCGAAGVLLSLCTALLLTACAGEEAEAEPEEIWQDVFQITRQDRRTEPQDETEVERVNLDVCGKDGVTLTEGGDIWVSGSLEGGRLIIDADEDELVHLYLSGVHITSDRGPAIEVKGASKVIVTLVSETESALSDSPDYTGSEESRACFYSVSDLTVNGGGALKVFGYHEDGIRSRDRIKLLGGRIEVQAKGDGIRGSDGILLADAAVDIQSEENGLRTANQDTSVKGVVEIRGGALSVIAGRNGIYAASDLYMRDCTCSINAVEEKVRAEGAAYIADGCLNE